MTTTRRASRPTAKRTRASVHKSAPQPVTTTHRASAVVHRGVAAATPAKRPPASQHRGQRRRAGRRPWWQGPTPLFGTLGVVALIVGIFVLQAHLTASGAAVNGPPAAVSAPVVREATQVDPRVLSAVKTGGLANPLTPVAAAPLLKDSSGKPIVLYVGGEFCPYCAAERWSLVVALGRFGTFSDLKLSQSSSTDVYPDTRTFSFAGSHFASQYLTFQGVETADRLQQPLEKLTAEQQSVMNKYDAPPYTQSAGSVPFTSIANQYLTNGSGYSPELIQGRSWEDISGRLSNPNDPVTQAIVGNANYLTAAICQVTGQQPASVCTAAPIPEIGRQLATHP